MADGRRRSEEAAVQFRQTPAGVLPVSPVEFLEDMQRLPPSGNEGSLSICDRVLSPRTRAVRSD
ncbi:MAG: hypothetical protein M3Y75_03300 [Actinomycetota bacterium]|nr:hypothetical protein [Actinomycetota bacterium]